METITFTATFTFPKESVLNFAEFMGYQNKIIEEVRENDTAISTHKEVDNPESAFDFIARLAKEHNELFVTKWADFLVEAEVQKQIGIIKPQLEQQIVQPVKDAIQVTYM